MCKTHWKCIFAKVIHASQPYGGPSIPYAHARARAQRHKQYTCVWPLFTFLNDILTRGLHLICAIWALSEAYKVQIALGKY